MIPIPSSLALKLVAGACALLMLALLVHDRNRWKRTATVRQEQIVGERNAHAATVANYRAAAERARREDAENLARVKASQAAINERTANDFESRITAARAAAANIASGRLRREGRAQTDSRGRGGAPVPAVPASAQGTVETAPQDGVPGNPSGTGSAGDLMSLSDRLIATEQAIQLDELIKWVRAQHQVKPNGD